MFLLKMMLAWFELIWSGIGNDWHANCDTIFFLIHFKQNNAPLKQIFLYILFDTQKFQILISKNTNLINCAILVIVCANPFYIRFSFMRA